MPAQHICPAAILREHFTISSTGSLLAKLKTHAACHTTARDNDTVGAPQLGWAVASLHRVKHNAHYQQPGTGRQQQAALVPSAWSALPCAGLPSFSCGVCLPRVHTVHTAYACQGYIQRMPAAVQRRPGQIARCRNDGAIANQDCASMVLQPLLQPDWKLPQHNGSDAVKGRGAHNRRLHVMATGHWQEAAKARAQLTNQVVQSSAGGAATACIT
jgi:hypothetical protein